MYEYVDKFAAWQGAKNGDDESVGFILESTYIQEHG